MVPGLFVGPRFGTASREAKAQSSVGVQGRNRACQTSPDRSGQNTRLHEGRTAGRWQSTEGEKPRAAGRDCQGAGGLSRQWQRGGGKAEAQCRWKQMKHWE